MADSLPDGWRVLPLRCAGLTARRPMPFVGSRPYLATADVEGVNLSPRETVTFSGRPARADLVLVVGDVLQAKMKSTNKAVLVGEEQAGWLASTGFAQFSPDPDVVAPRFLFHWLASDLFSVKKDALCVGSTQQAISESWLGAMDLLLCCPTEQRRIAAVLDTLDEAIGRTEQAIAKLQQMRQGLLHDLLTRGVDENGDLRPAPEEAPHLYRDSPLGQIPRGWEVSSGAGVCREVVVGIVIRPTQYYRAEGVPVLRSANVREDCLDSADLVFMSPRDHAVMSKSAVSPGDVVTVRTGYPGTTCVVPESLPEANCVDIIISRPGPRITSDFLSTWVNSSFGKELVLRVQGGLAQQHFNIGEMKHLMVVLPQLGEQERLNEIVASVRRRLEREEAGLAKLGALKHGLLHDLLTGRVRVPLPAEEPA